MLKLGALVGPTAVGKTDISIRLAEAIGAEIISCDSMAVYHGMDIGTAKPTSEERHRVPHHLVDIVDPSVNFTVADYQQQARELIKTITARGRIPLLVGGTGLYYQAVADNYDFFPVEAVQPVRQKWEQECSDQGLPCLFEQLKMVDPDYAAKIGPNDKKRIIRALEVHELTGQSFSSLQTSQRNTYRLAAVGLYLERSQLYARIEERVDKMITDGLVEEVIRLRKQGYDRTMNSMMGLGYKQVGAYLDGLLDFHEMIAAIKLETRRYAKRQYTWFKKDKRIHWINMEDYHDSKLIIDKICEFMDGQFLKA